MSHSIFNMQLKNVRSRQESTPKFDNFVTFSQRTMAKCK
jgi:hypothetical protein